MTITTTPSVGMEFDSVDAAWQFWVEYGRKTGFGVRKQYLNKKKEDGSIRSCRFVCCKEGHRVVDKRSFIIKNPRVETRTGCKARIALSTKNGKYVIHEFVEEHNHPLQLAETRHMLVSHCKISEVQTYELEMAKDFGLRQKALFQLMSAHAGVDTNEGCRVLESSSGGELGISDDHVIQEPYEGMEFESEDAAKIFYDEYARHVGFVMRVMSCRRSERDGRILARRLGCNKEGHCVSIRGKFGSVRKPRSSTREGCKAMIHIKYDKSGKWVITKFVKDHNHPLIVSPREARQTMDEKDKKIQELTAELRNKKRLCATYQEQLTSFMKIVEEHSDKLCSRVHHILNDLKEFESIEELLHQR